VTKALWFGHRDAWRLIGLAYLPWFAGLNLAWEIAHVRLYTLWSEREAAYIAFSILHCTLGDVLIGAAALLVALIAGREGPPAEWRWRRIAVLTALVGTGYTVFSEWMNIALFRNWTYAQSMPVFALGGFELGLTPLLQWLAVPALSLYLARAAGRRLVQQAD
jgi:hypothetical protein